MKIGKVNPSSCRFPDTIYSKPRQRDIPGVVYCSMFLPLLSTLKPSRDLLLRYNIDGERSRCPEVVTRSSQCTDVIIALWNISLLENLKVDLEWMHSHFLHFIASLRFILSGYSKKGEGSTVTQALKKVSGISLMDTSSVLSLAYGVL
jgi:hypothetical protein